MKEMAIHQWFKVQAKKRWGDKFLHIKAPSGIYSSRRGISDFICCIHGSFVAVEVKSPTGKITPIQQVFLDDVEKADGISVLLIGKDESIFDEIDRQL